MLLFHQVRCARAKSGSNFSIHARARENVVVPAMTKRAQLTRVVADGSAFQFQSTFEPFQIEWIKYGRRDDVSRGQFSDARLHQSIHVAIKAVFVGDALEGGMSAPCFYSGLVRECVIRMEQARRNVEHGWLNIAYRSTQCLDYASRRRIRALPQILRIEKVQAQWTSVEHGERGVVFCLLCAHRLMCILEPALAVPIGHDRIGWCRGEHRAYGGTGRRRKQCATTEDGVVEVRRYYKQTKIGVDHWLERVAWLSNVSSNACSLERSASRSELTARSKRFDAIGGSHGDRLNGQGWIYAANGRKHGTIANP